MAAADVHNPAMPTPSGKFPRIGSESQRELVTVRRTFLALVLLAAVTAAARPVYIHGTAGKVEVLSSESPEKTKEFLYSLLEVRAQIAMLTGSTLMPDPPVHVVIFAQVKDLDDLVPASMHRADGRKAISFVVFRPWGGMVALANDANYDSSRGLVLTAYARFLLSQVAPANERLWIIEGLPDALSTIDYTKGRIVIGRKARDYDERISARRLLPLGVLTDDKALGPYLDSFYRKSQLYCEAWSLWHLLLTDHDRSYDAGIARFFDDLREGETPDATTLARDLGLTLDELQSRRKEHASHGRATIERDPSAADLMARLELAPADEIDRLVALAIVGSDAKDGQPEIAAELLQAGAAHPESARLREAAAILAAGSGDPGGADYKWGLAREAGTSNPYPYLVAANDTGILRSTRISLDGSISGAEASHLRHPLDRCLELDPGCVEANLKLAWTEAIAPDPRADQVARIARSQLPKSYPQFLLPLAIAKWRLGDRAEAHALLTSLGHSRLAPPPLKTTGAELQGLMVQREDASSPASK
jgi:hypothetical protein